MKNILFIIFFALFLPKVAFSKNYHDQIFGIKILDDVNSYIEECDIGGTYLVTENCIGLLTWTLKYHKVNISQIDSFMVQLCVIS